jgi:hypothetical protein
MLVDRNTVLEKLKGYLDNTISKKEIFEWAHSIVITQDYDKISKTDKLLSESIHALWQLHHDDGKFDPSREELEYYMKCLEGKEKFPPQKK